MENWQQLKSLQWKRGRNHSFKWKGILEEGLHVFQRFCVCLCVCVCVCVCVRPLSGGWRQRAATHTALRGGCIVWRLGGVFHAHINTHTRSPNKRLYEWHAHTRSLFSGNFHYYHIEQKFASQCCDVCVCLFVNLSAINGSLAHEITHDWVFARTRTQTHTKNAHTVQTCKLSFLPLHGRKRKQKRTEQRKQLAQSRVTEGN